MNTTPTYEELEQKVKNLEDTLLVMNSLKENTKINDFLLKILFDIIPNPIFYKDASGIYQHCNDAFSKTILGISKNEIIGKNIYDLAHIIPKEHADLFSTKDNELFKNHGVQFYEGKVKCSDGKTRHYNFYKSTFESDGNVLGLVGVMLDVSDYKNALFELDKKNTILNNLSITDALTDLHNRRYFDIVFEKNLSLLERYGNSFSFALIDIDFFKDYNDCHGHPAGDEALQKVGKVLKETLNRPTDYIFRLGGEEFGVLFSIENSKNTVSLIERLRKNIENLKLTACRKEVSEYLTVSIGLANINYIKGKKVASKKIYDEVDSLLYQSKHNGRNQITFKEINK